MQARDKWSDFYGSTKYGVVYATLIFSTISTTEVAMRQYFCCWPTASFKWHIGPTYGPYLREERANEKSIFRIFLFYSYSQTFNESCHTSKKERKYLRLKDCYSTG
jgi:hypothetical protein